MFVRYYTNLKEHSARLPNLPGKVYRFDSRLEFAAQIDMLFWQQKEKQGYTVLTNARSLEYVLFKRGKL